ncbi:MAG: ribonuclease H family protein [Roseburia sp.]|nr:ribonuclease H family protein [Roseburia sp.]
MAKKFYAVKAGRETGIFETWAECRNQIHGFSGAIYKSFATKAEAEAFVGAGGGEQCPVSGGGVPAVEAETQAVAYVDGSYDAAANAFSYGMVLFHNGQEQHFSEKYMDEDLAQMHNVAGEIKGAEAAMRYCLDNGIPSITIYHDYEGIARWCTGEWQAKKEGTIAYAEYYKRASAKVDIRFVKVKGHSGDTYNELADRLAKSALGNAALGNAAPVSHSG